jgi:hypothetical protein
MLVGTDYQKIHRAITGNHVLRRRNSGEPLNKARMYARKKWRVLEMRMLTLRMLVWSMEAVMVGNVLKLADSDDDR